MPDLRIRGEDVQVRVTVDGEEILELDHIESFSGTIRIDITEAEFLGRTDISVDAILKGGAGNMTLQVQDEAIFDFFTILIDATARRTAFPTINVQGQIVFPSGAARAALFRDVVFGDIPLNFANRSSYGQVTLTWRCGSPPDFAVV